MLVIGLVVSIALFFEQREREWDLVRTEFERHASAHATALQTEIDRNLEVLESVGGLFATSGDVSRQGRMKDFDGKMAGSGLGRARQAPGLSAAVGVLGGDNTRSCQGVG